MALFSRNCGDAIQFKTWSEISHTDRFVVTMPCHTNTRVYDCHAECSQHNKSRHTHTRIHAYGRSHSRGTKNSSLIGHCTRFRNKVIFTKNEAENKNKQSNREKRERASNFALRMRFPTISPAAKIAFFLSFFFASAEEVGNRSNR